MISFFLRKDKGVYVLSIETSILCSLKLRRAFKQMQLILYKFLLCDYACCPFSFYEWMFSGIRRWDNMSLYEGDEMDHVADDNEMAEVDDVMYFRDSGMGDSDSDDDDDDEYDHLVCSYLILNDIWYDLILI